jgi:hypothetical protein
MFLLYNSLENYFYQIFLWLCCTIRTRYCSRDNIEKNKMGGACSGYGERRGVYMVLVEKPEGKKPLGRPRRRWEDNIKIYLQELGCGGMGWIELAEDRDRWRSFLTAVMNLRVP